MVEPGQVLGSDGRQPELFEIIEELDAEGEESVRGQEMRPAQPARLGPVDIEKEGDRVQDAQGPVSHPQSLRVDGVDEPIDGIDPGRDESRPFAGGQGFPEIVRRPLLGKNNPIAGIVLPLRPQLGRDRGDEVVPGEDPPDIHVTSSHRP